MKRHRQFVRDAQLRLSKDVLHAFRVKCDFYDLHPIDVIAHLLTLFARTDQLDKYFNINPEDSIFLKDREKYYKNLKVR